MSPRRERWVVTALIAVFLALITLPFVYAHSLKTADQVFSGFLVNPIDGNSYLAKMRQGSEGSWTFTLPYTNDPGEGAAINLYYLFLGHIADWFELPLIGTFHLARVLGALALCLSLYAFFVSICKTAGQRLFAFSLVLFGSGLGWLAIGAGFFTSDFWVAEAFPFLASFTNAHFPIGLALQVWLLTPRSEAESKAELAWMAAAGLLLSVVYPFGWATTVAILSGWLAWQLWRKEQAKDQVTRLLVTVAGGLPFGIYSLWIANTHPVLLQWTAQNVTPAPNPLDLIISLSPTLLLALVGLRFVKQADSRVIFLLAWLLVGVLILYAPLSLQRRLISGLYVPVSALAAYALWNLRLKSARRALLGALVVVLALPTNALILAGGMRAVAQGDPALVISPAELAGLAWLTDHAKAGLVLAGPETGVLIPAYADARVLYGHPFETPHASARLAEVSAFFAGELDADQQLQYLQANQVDFIWYGPREQELGPLPAIAGWGVAYDSGGVAILGPDS